MIHRYYKDIVKPFSAVVPALSFSSIITLTLGFSLVSTVVMAGTVSLPMETLPSRISLPNVSPANSALANRGAYVARSADCMACHRADYSGGVPIETPIGNIYSTNITPSTRYGIGNYTEADFKKSLTQRPRPKSSDISCHALSVLSRYDR
ncbi:hypothetical protein [Psychrobacter sp. JCM 18901]|uniref:hypothetical protein n=1 Tax=Psychrobacter sp. JCM 18901 TaxID=1298609 RepID=UPI0004B22E6C|nr:hypothetical protein [Psychrobacter sp. JCM 18901]